MARKQFGGGSAQTTLNGGITNSATSATLTDGSTYPDGSVGPFVIVIDAEGASEEKVLVTSRSGNALSGITRGYDGTSAVAHDTGVIVRHVLDADTVNEANAHVNDDARDDHSQYLNTARHDVTARHPTAVIADAAVTTVKIADGNVTAAKLVAAIPLGVLGRASVTADQGGISTAVDLTGLSTAVTVAASRLIKITGFCNVLHSGTNNQVDLLIKEGGTQLAAARVECVTGNLVQQIICVALVAAPSAGAHTYKLTLDANGVASATMKAGATIPAFILVEDVGAA